MLKYARGPVSFLYKDVVSATTGKTSRKKAKQILWGDWVRVVGPEKAGWMNVTYGKKPFLMRDKDLQDERVLEIIFLDVGQGDGCILTEPGSHADPRILVIDAGVGSNMSGFLHWRFRDFPETGAIHAAIITHPDNDHYKGFSRVFAKTEFSISHVWHSGIVERTGPDRLGPAKDGYLTDVVATNAAAEALLGPKANRGRMTYPNLLKTAIDSPRIGPIEALTTMHAEHEDGRAWAPGFRPSDPGPVAIEVLGPVVEPDAAGTARLRQFGGSPRSTSPNDGKTKNGHSVLLRLEFSGFRVLFGGDLNLPAETFLMLHYGDDQPPPPPLSGDDPRLARIDLREVIERAAETFDVDLMKTCHHGSSDVTDAFLEATSASAYVISSGDEEGHVHPRPDLLGLLGKMGSGPRPLLLSTELLRSTRENEDPKLGKDLDKVTEQIEAEIVKGDDKDAALLKELRAKRKKLQQTLLRRNVGVYGAVNLRTDGKEAVIAFRKEVVSDTNRWFYYEMKRQPSGAFEVELEGE